MVDIVKLVEEAESAPKKRGSYKKCRSIMKSGFGDKPKTARLYEIRRTARSIQGALQNPRNQQIYPWALILSNHPAQEKFPRKREEKLAQATANFKSTYYPREP